MGRLRFDVRLYFSNKSILVLLNVEWPTVSYPVWVSHSRLFVISAEDTNQDHPGKALTSNPL